MSNKLNKLNELDETEILEDLLTDNEQSFDEFFDWKKLDNDKDKHNSFPRRRTYAYTKGRAYVPRKEAHINEERDKGYHSGDCKFYINAYCRKRDNLVYIMKINGEHNHPLVKNINMVAFHYCKLTPEMHDDVKLFATCGVRTGAIIEVLQVKYPDNSDASSMYLELMKQQQENPTFHVDACFEGQDNHLTRLCWMSPSQLQLWSCFHDVVLLDTTAKTNRYFMILYIVILIDNHNRSRLAATAIVSDEIKETFSWLFSSISKATNRLIPKLLYTDADPAMVAAASSTWTTIKHHFCLFHIRKNLEKHFLGKYGEEKWKEFFTVFCHARNSRVEFIFEEKWAALLQKYDDAANYLQRHLYKSLFKLQRHEINRSMHYRCCITNLENELEKQFTAEIPNGIFSEDMFDACVIELKQLITDLDMKRITELWRISSIDRKITYSSSFFQSVKAISGVT
ncbi:5533_t:CDS:2 [Rhizophagus irregularis]|nr:5533_t:CDS:2 [Rhizophagus irregularis]